MSRRYKFKKIKEAYDQRKENVEKKLMKEMEGRLIIYRNIYTPKKLKNVIVIDKLNFAVFVNIPNNGPL